MAARLAEGVSFVRDLLRRFRQSGSMTGKPAGDGAAAADAAVCGQIEALVDAHNNHAIEPPRQSLATVGRRLSHTTLGQVLRDLAWTCREDVRR